MPLTTAQQSVLDYIRGFIRITGYSPTTREICQQFGWSSPQAAQGHLRALLREGALTCERGSSGRVKARTLRVVEGANQ